VILILPIFKLEGVLTFQISQ